MTAGFNMRMPTEPRCWMCDTTEGLRICSQDPWGGNTEYVCAGCFKGTDTGPCFDDLPTIPANRDGITASTVMSAVNLGAVMADHPTRLLSTAALVAASLQSLSIDTGADAPEEV
jgi:hypothetical protein